MSRDIAISSREVSVQVVDQGLRVAYVGTPGPPGPQGPPGQPGSASFGRWQGQWNQTTPYNPGDVVTYQTNPESGWATYYCVQQNTNKPPAANSPAFWMILTSAGTGAGDAAGPPGPAPFRMRGPWQQGADYVGDSAADGTILKTCDVVTFGADGDGESLWLCTNDHNAQNASWAPYPDTPNNWILLAAAGDNGADGKTLRSGSSAPGNNIGNPGDFYIQTGASPKLFGPKGANTWPSGVGLKGEDGDDGAVTSVSAVPVAAGNPPTASLSGPVTARSIQFGIPSGAAGAPGASALAWASFYFEIDGTLRMVVPVACRIKIGDAVEANEGSFEVRINGVAQTGNVDLEAGDRVAVIASGVSSLEGYSLSIPFQAIPSGS